MNGMGTAHTQLPISGLTSLCNFKAELSMGYQYEVIALFLWVYYHVMLSYIYLTGCMPPCTLVEFFFVITTYVLYTTKTASDF